jgi:hypothetical protein
MDQSAVKKWVDKHLKKLMRRMGIPHWSITVRYEHIEGDTMAHILPQLKYEIAEITIDSSKIKEEEQLEKLILHELSHVLTSPYTMFWDSVAHALPEGSIESFKELFIYAEEMTVKNLERMSAMHKEAFNGH